MPIELKVEIRGLKEVEALLKGYEKQMPFAIAKALTDTAKDVQTELMRTMPQVLDRPTKFTQRAFGVEKATKRSLQSRVFIKRIQAEYLRWQVEGGTRRDSGKGFGVPRKRKRNQYGNIPGRRKGLVKGRSEFIATINGKTGVWRRRPNRKLELMVEFEKETKYEPKLPFYKIAEQTADRTFQKNFDKALAFALRTAK